MTANLLLAALTVLAALQPAPDPPDPPDHEAAGAAFRRALVWELEPEERVAELERVVKEHADTHWADDALWVLGEAARQRQLWDRVIGYWQLLMTQYPEVQLEDFTRTLGLYQTSGLPQVQFYLDKMGLNYVLEAGARTQERRSERYLVNAAAYSPLPMAIWDGLGHAYALTERPVMALRAYRNALACAPARGPWRGKYNGRIQALEQLVPPEPVEGEEIPPEQPPPDEVAPADADVDADEPEPAEDGPGPEQDGAAEGE